MVPSLQFCGNEEFLTVRIPRHLQHIRLAARLTVFDIALVATGRLVHDRFVPLAASGTLKARVQSSSQFSQSRPRLCVKWKSFNLCSARTALAESWEKDFNRRGRKEKLIQE